MLDLTLNKTIRKVITSQRNQSPSHRPQKHLRNLAKVYKSRQKQKKVERRVKPKAKKLQLSQKEDKSNQKRKENE
jgi:hypothetical protein